MRDRFRARSAEAVIDEAAEWIVRLTASDVTQEDQRAFVAWLKQSPVHIREYLRAESLWSDLESIDGARSISVRDLAKQVDWSIVELRPDIAEPAAASGERPRKRALPMALAASLAVVAIGFVAWLGVHRAGDVYETKVGEQRIVRLADGSTVTLNTATRIEVELSQAARIVRLAQGEALFKVAKDPARPFRVLSGDAVAQAVGTTFNVRRDDAGTVVTVLEGRVAVARPEDLITLQSIEVPKLAVLVDGGKRAEVHEENIRTAAIANPEAAVAWRNRRLIFDDEPLSHVAAEFNRYNELQLTIADPTLAQERVSGVFDADQPMTLVRFLERSNAIAPTHEREGRLVLEAP